MGIGSDIRIYLESERMWMRLFAVGEETENGSEKGYPNFDLVPFNLSTYPPPSIVLPRHHFPICP